jgi:hypothetical protein
MTIIAFPSGGRPRAGRWCPAELNQFVASLAPNFQNGEASGWDVGATEAGDPQFYLLGPAPDHECMLCVSRLGSLYVLEDGAGQVLLEHDSLLALAETMKTVLRTRKAKFVSRVALIWCAIREACAEKFEAMVGESEELLIHFAPQLAALA